MAAMQSVTKASLAKEIRAVMDSTPNGLDSKQIESDYRSLVGKSLRDRVKSLGHTDVDSFLLLLSKEGSVQLEHTSFGYLYRAAVADKSTVHLQALVKNQHKKSRKGEANRRRTSSGRPQCSPMKKVLPKAMESNLVALVRERHRSVQLCDLLKLYHDKYGATFNFRPYGFSCLKESVCSVDELTVTCKGDNAFVSIASAAPLMTSPTYENIRRTLCSVVTKVLGEAEIPLYKFRERHLKIMGKDFDPKKYGFSSLLNLMDDLVETVNLRRDNVSDEWFISHVSTKSSHSCTNTQKETPKKKRIPYELIKMIREVVEGIPSGVYVANFDETFKLEKQLDLSPHTYGFESMKALLSEAVNERIEIVTAKFGLMIRVKASDDKVAAGNVVKHSLSDTTQDIHDAVGPGVCFNPSIHPPLNTYIVLIVSQVYNPGSFYVQLMPNDNSGKRLEELMDLLEEVYKPLEASQIYKLPLMFAVPGQLVVCRFPNDTHWHRARITKVIDVNFVQVIFVDYGTRCAVHKTQLFYLKQQFLGLPVQAQPATLFGISPAVGDTWSAAASRTFLNLTSDKRLCALVKSIDRDQRLSLCLTDTSADIDIHINDYLVTSEFATFADMTAQVPRQNSNQVDEILSWSVSSEGEDSGDESDAAPVPAPHLSTQLSATTAKVTSTKASPPVEAPPTAEVSPPVDAPPPTRASLPVEALPITKASLPVEALPTTKAPPPVEAPPNTKAPPPVEAPPATKTITSSPLKASLNNNTFATGPPVTDNAIVSGTIVAPIKSEKLSKEAPRSRHSESAPFIPSTSSVSLTPPLVSAGQAPALGSIGAAPMLGGSGTPVSTLAHDRVQQTAMVKPQMLFHNNQVLPQRPLPPLPTNPQFHQNMLYQHQSDLLLTPNMVMPSNQLPVYRPTYSGFNPHYMMQPAPFYPIQAQYNPQYYQHNTPVRPSNFSLQQTNLAFNASGVGDWVPPLQHINSRSTNVHVPLPVSNVAKGPPPLQHINSQSTSEHPATTKMPPLVNVAHIEAEGSQAVPAQVEGGTEPPPLMHVSSGDTSVDGQEKRESDGPPPLISVNAIQQVGNSSISAHEYSNQLADATGKPNQSTASTAKHLEYKLAGLHLKRKRIQRHKLEKELADYSGAESSDSELSSLEQEIVVCKEQLSKVAGGSSDKLLNSCGRGRGRLHLMALASAD